MRLDPEAVLDFARHFEARYQRAYRWDLWGAAWVLLDGCSDDAFDFFRCWLIGQGREVFEGALHDPDALADLLDDFDEEIDGDGEDLGYAADEAYEQLTGLVMPDLGLLRPPRSRRARRSTSRTRHCSPRATHGCGRGSAGTEPRGAGAGRRSQAPVRALRVAQGAALACMRAEAVEAAGPRTTAAAATRAVQGRRRASAQVVLRSGCRSWAQLFVPCASSSTVTRCVSVPVSRPGPVPASRPWRRAARS